MFLTTGKKAIAASTAILSVGGLGLFGGNAISKKTISDNLGEVKLVSIKNSPNSSHLSRLFLKFLDSGEPKSSLFKELFDLLKKKSSSVPVVYDDVFPVWKKACGEYPKETYSSWFQKNDDFLLEDVKNACSIKISQIINPSRGEFNFSLVDSYDKSERNGWKSNLNFLKQEESKSKRNSIYSVIFGVDKIIDSDEEGNINKLYKWCRESLNSYYVEDSDIPSLTDKYCTGLDSQ